MLAVTAQRLLRASSGRPLRPVAVVRRVSVRFYVRCDVTNVAAQQEIAMLKRHLKLQGDVITGMCRLRAFEAENRSPT